MLTTKPYRAGVTGLTTALQIQSHLHLSQSLLLLAKDFPPSVSINYASPWAGAHCRPIPGTSTQALRESNQARRTYAFLNEVAGKEPAAGVEKVDGFEYLEAPEGGYLDREGVEDAYGGGYLEGFEELRSSEDSASGDGKGGGGLPDRVKWGVRYKSFVINSPVYCAYLLRRFVLRGGRTREYTLADLREAFHLAENVRTVINCSGMGFGDPKSFIIRGACIPYTNPNYMPLLNCSK